MSLAPLVWYGLSVAVVFPRSSPPAVVDSGSYRVYRYDSAVGTESFSLESMSDSLVIKSHVLQILPGEGRPDTLDKSMLLVVRSDDYDIRSYESHQTLRGQRLQRGLVMSDTSFTSYFQVNDRGQGDQLVRPPGRMFVIDPQLFILYDVICRNLHGKSFDQRPITLFELGVPDTVIEATATDLGADTLRWGARRVVARKLKISDPDVEFFVWISPQGTMLRLAQPEYGLRVERAPPPVRNRERRPQSRGTGNQRPGR